jgi:monovalent cation/hydrogen antiporter
MELYRQRIDGRSKTGEERALARRMDEIERKLRLAGLGAERTELYRIAWSRKLSDETARRLVREIDLLEARLGTR